VPVKTDKEHATHVGPGVYLLFNRARKIVYVGRSNYPPERIRSHRVNGRPFSHSAILPCSEEDSHWIEKALIEAMQPPQNRAGVRNPLVEAEPEPVVVERVIIKEPAPVRATWEPPPVMSMAEAKRIVFRHQLQREFAIAIEDDPTLSFFANAAYTGKGHRRNVPRGRLMEWIEEADRNRRRA